MGCGPPVCRVARQLQTVVSSLRKEHAELEEAYTVLSHLQDAACQSAWRTAG